MGKHYCILLYTVFLQIIRLAIFYAGHSTKEPAVKEKYLRRPYFRGLAEQRSAILVPIDPNPLVDCSYQKGGIFNFTIVLFEVNDA